MSMVSAWGIHVYRMYGPLTVSIRIRQSSLQLYVVITVSRVETSSLWFKLNWFSAVQILQYTKALMLIFPVTKLL